MSEQLPLSLGPRDGASFDTFFPGTNSEAVAHLEALGQRRCAEGTYLWGPAGCGRSHLLQAVCQAAGRRGAAAIYLPMAGAAQFPVEALEGMEHMAAVCIDDVHLIAGQTQWEEAVAGLADGVRSHGGDFVAAGDAPPPQLAVAQRPLGERLATCVVIQLHHLEEGERQQALQLRARRRGFELPVDTADYLVRRFGANTSTLFECLQTLDRASLASRRKLNLPFVRSALREAGLL